MLTLVEKLHRTGLLTVAGLLHLPEAVLTNGLNLMTLLSLAARLHPRRVAVVDERERLSYAQLWHQAGALAVALQRDHGVGAGRKAAIVCRNHAAAIKALFALSRLGTHVYLVNPDLSADQLLALGEQLRFDFYVYDEPFAAAFENPALRDKAVPAYHPSATSVDRMSSRPAGRKVRLKNAYGGNIVVMTGGTTGQPKPASRKPSVLNFLPPFIALLTQVHLDRYRSVYVATPIYHGFGLASLVMGIVLGAEMYLTRRFDAERSSSLIARHRIEVVTLVPLMLQRMLAVAPGSLSCLRCLITGGAALSPALAQEVLARLGPKVFNLYGTSEAGFAIMATPDGLRGKPSSIGKPVFGVQARILGPSDEALGDQVIGRLCIRSCWTTSRQSWIETGDLAYRDSEGDLFLCGRVDDLVVSGGEKVYPVELENVLLQHPEVNSAAVVGIPDAEFGQRLKAVVVRRRGTALDPAALLAWLKPRVARYQMPAVVEFRDELPYTSLGKPDKQSLRAGGTDPFQG
jgi:acyl-CoA synthetase (AMP-forming)/AMP-acid ligase II